MPRTDTAYAANRSWKALFRVLHFSSPIPAPQIDRSTDDEEEGQFVDQCVDKEGKAVAKEGAGEAVGGMEEVS